MLDVKVTIDPAGLKYLKSMPAKFKEGILKGMRKAAFYAEGKAKKGFGSGSGPPNPPPGPLKVRTGHLRRSIRSGVVKNMLTGWIGTNVFYGKVHEESTKFPRPFLRPAVENNIDKINELIKQSILREYP